MAVDTSYPTGGRYQEVLQNTRLAFRDPVLRGGRPVLDRLGMPKAISGNFASVFTIRGNDGNRWAVKCFTRHVPDQDVRYQQVSKTLQGVSSQWKVRFEYLPAGVLCQGTWYPALKMEWVEATGLLTHIEANLSNHRALADLARKFGYLVQDLSRHGIAHGDLQHGNILVTRSGELKLVDYDGMFVPGLAGFGASELGHPNYQSPRRTETDWGPDIDRFSSWVIYASLTALALDPTLWRTLHVKGDEALLFKKSDFADRDHSRVRYALMNSSVGKLREIGRDIDFLWTGDLTAVPPLEAVAPDGTAAQREAVRAANGTVTKHETGTDWLRQMRQIGAMPPSSYGAAAGTAAAAADAQGSPAAAGPARPIGAAAWLTTHLPVAPHIAFTRPAASTRVVCAMLLSFVALFGALAAVTTPVLAAFDAVLLPVFWIASFVSYMDTPVWQEKQRHYKLLSEREQAVAAANRSLSALEHAARELDREAEVSKAAARGRASKARADEQREIAAIESRLAADISRLDSAMIALQNRLSADRANALRPLQEAHVDACLRAAKISSSEIPGIGSGLVSSLAACGIVTAADFTDIYYYQQKSYGRRKVQIVRRNWTLVSPRGFGEKKAIALDTWRRVLVLHAQSTQPKALPHAQEEAIVSKYAKQVQSVEYDQRLARTRAAEQHAAARQNWATTHADIAQELSEVTARFAQFRAQQEPGLAAARQQSGTAEWQRDFAKRELDRYRRITYARYLWKLLTG